MTSEEYVKRLTEISNKKYELLQDMYLLTDKQSKAISEEKVEILDELISQKQNLINLIDKSDNEFNVYFQRFKQTLGVKSLDEVKEPTVNGVEELQDCVKKIMGLLKDITQLDDKNKEAVKKTLNQLGDEIRKGNQGKKVSMAYNPGSLMQPPSYFVDKKK